MYVLNTSISGHFKSIELEPSDCRGCLDRTLTVEVTQFIFIDGLCRTTPPLVLGFFIHIVTVNGWKSTGPSKYELFGNIICILLEEREYVSRITLLEFFTLVSLFVN